MRGGHPGPNSEFQVLGIFTFLEGLVLTLDSQDKNSDHWVTGSTSAYSHSLQPPAFGVQLYSQSQFLPWG